LKIAVLSGKGGTGKTLVAVNLAYASGKCVYLDCDVEEPNGRLFLKPEKVDRTPIVQMTPRVNAEKCVGCRACVRFCRFGALAFVGGKPLLTGSVCHACGGCAYVCPVGAIAEQPRAIGMVERGSAADIDVRTGILNPGEASGVPVIRALLDGADAAEDVFIDCPPGTACAAMECVRAADLCVLVAEPTRYGAHNLAMAAELCDVYHKPRVAVMNKCAAGENPSETYCAAHGIPVFARIPYDAALGWLNSAGAVVSRELPWVKELFEKLLGALRGEADA
jgi:MinD superfamily P-loop ATPase